MKGSKFGNGGTKGAAKLAPGNSNEFSDAKIVNNQNTSSTPMPPPLARSGSDYKGTEKENA